jgi:hypothetical protein
MTENWMSYIAREKCGAIVCCTVDEPQYAKQIAKDVASWIRDGLNVERVNGEVIRQSFCKCPKDSTKMWDNKTCKDCKFNK